MAREKHPLDHSIIKLLQEKGLVKKEAHAYLKKEVYQLEASDIIKVNNYAAHFGLSAKEKMIEEVLDLRRERILNRLKQGEIKRFTNR